MDAPSIQVGEKIAKHLTALCRFLQSNSRIMWFCPVWIHQHNLCNEDADLKPGTGIQYYFNRYLEYFAGSTQNQTMSWIFFTINNQTNITHQLISVEFGNLAEYHRWVVNLEWSGCDKRMIADSGKSEQDNYLQTTGMIFFQNLHSRYVLWHVPITSITCAIIIMLIQRPWSAIIIHIIHL